MATDSLVSSLQHSRRDFLDLVAEVRPDLHRYCSRMMGSVVDGEDVVQDTLARACYALADLEPIPPLRPWLFQIAHNRALDLLRGYDRRKGESLEEIGEVMPDLTVPPADEALAREEAVRAAISRFAGLIPMQRSCVVLKDVLGHSVDEIAELLEVSVPAVKAALHRGRVRLRELADSTSAEPAPTLPASPTLVRYAALFNARDWDGLRGLLAEDVRLDVVSRSQRSGRSGVGTYFGNYDGLRGWRVAPARVENREVLVVFRSEHDARPRHLVELVFADGFIRSIRDFWHVGYILEDAEVALVE